MSRLERFHCTESVYYTDVSKCVSYSSLLLRETALSPNSASFIPSLEFCILHRMVNNNSSKRINIVNNYNSTHLVLVLIVCCWFLESLWSSSLKSLFLTATEARSVPPNDARASCLALSACECECECCICSSKQKEAIPTR